MGVLNMTPDSFSDGGAYLAPSAALARLREVAEEGAAICDIGAESTRPGSEPVPAPQQLRRLAGLFAALGEAAPVPISIDTSSAAVAEAALDAGAVLVNDVTAGAADDRMLPLVAERGAGVCLVHMRGDPRTMQQDPRYDDVVGEVREALARRLDAAVAAGVAAERVVLDPGIGFGKTVAHNLALIAGLGRIAALGRPVVVGVSRKGMFGRLLGRPVGERLPGSLAAGLAAVAAGAAVLRVHDVRATADALAVWTSVGAYRTP